MSESTQHKIDRIRKPRVHITYDVHIGDAIQKKEIPYIIGILADLSGNPKNPLPIVSKRSFVNIDRDNLNDVLKASNARLEFSVPNKIDQSSDSLHIELNFKNMKDFEPLSIIKQVPEIKTIHTSKVNLLDLLAKMENNAILRDIIKLLAEDPDFRGKFKEFIASKKKEISGGSSSGDTAVEYEASIEQLLKDKIKEVEKDILSNKEPVNDGIQGGTLGEQFAGISNTENKTSTTSTTNPSDNQQNASDTTTQTPPQTTNNNTASTTAPNTNTSQPQTTGTDTTTNTTAGTNSTPKQSTNVNDPKVEK